ncbi:MAG: C-GCAxxG-C-C family protein [Desulfobacula sp.]|jgi:C_GCAxxG_C_C family probable redox protein
MNKTGNKVQELFASGFFCAESVLKAVAIENDVDDAILPAIATGFCGGMSRHAEMCGAVTGGIMGLGLVFGRNTVEEKTQNCYEAVSEFLKAFKELHGSLNCKELIGYDLGVADELEKFRTDNPGYEKCVRFSMDAASMVQGIINSRKNTCK